MQIESLKVFCDLAETGSFTKAGQLNGITQSAVTQQVHALERRFKALLIERSNKRFRLTREGEVLYQFGKQIANSYESLQYRLQEVKNVVSGTIRLAAVYCVGLYDLPPCIRRFLKSYPTVNLQVRYRHLDEVYEDVSGNAADLGIVVYPAKDSRLEIVPLRKDQMALICHPQHPLAQLKTATLQALSGQKLVGFPGGSPARKALDRALREQGIEVQYVMQLDNIETIKRAVEIDAGVAVVPPSTVAQEVTARTLAAVTLEDESLQRPVAAIFKKDKVLSPAMRQFLALLKES